MASSAIIEDENADDLVTARYALDGAKQLVNQMASDIDALRDHRGAAA